MRRGAATLWVCLMMISSQAAFAAEFTVRVSPLEASLSRVLDSRDLAVVIAAHPDPDALEVVEVLYGDIATGRRLAFADCFPILIMGSSEDFLRQIVERSPVLDTPARGLRRVELPDGRKPESYPPPGPDARYLVFLNYRGGSDHWGFAYQTYGDFYLLGRDRVFRSIHLNESVGKAWVRVYPEVTSEAFLDHVKTLLAAERAGAGAEAKSAAP